MPLQQLTLTNPSITSIPQAAPGTPVTIYLKNDWVDNWQLASDYLSGVVEGDFFLQSASWASDGTISMASFVHRYGEKLIGTGKLVTNAFDPARVLVKVHLGTPLPWTHPISPWPTYEAPSYATWVGVFDSEKRTLLGGDGTAVVEGDIEQAGIQVFQAFGLEYLFKQTFVMASWYVDALGKFQLCQRAIDFNADGKPNRSVGLVGSSFVFSGESDAVFWSTRNIMDYLLKQFNPPGLLYKEDLASMNRLPDFDRPVIRQHGARLLEVIRDAVSSRRFYNWHFAFDEADLFDEVTFKLEPESYSFRVSTYNTAPVVVQKQPFGAGLGGGFGSPTETGLGAGFGAGFGGEPVEIPANDRILDIDADLDSSVDVTIDYDHTNKVDQVIVQGARRTNCFTMYFEGTDKNAKEYWTSSLASGYDSADGSGKLPAKQRKLDAEFRQQDKYEDVYSRFGLDTTKNFPKDDRDNYSVSPFSLNILPVLPLLEGRDYKDNNIANGTITNNGTVSQSFRKLYVAMKDPESDRYIAAHKIGTLSRDAAIKKDDPIFDWTTTVEASSGDPSFRILVHGKPQYVIAKGTASPNSVDIPSEGEVDWRQMTATVAIQDDRFCEFRFPFGFDINRWNENGVLIPAKNIPNRVIVINAGQSYRLDWVSANTVVDVDDGKLVKTTSGAFLNDDRLALSYVGRAAWQFYGVTRAVMRLASNYSSPATGIARGVMIGRVRSGTIGAVPGEPDTAKWITVNSVITSISVSYPWGESSHPNVIAGRPRMTVMTATGELDLSLFNIAGPRIEATPVQEKNRTGAIDLESQLGEVQHFDFNQSTTAESNTFRMRRELRDAEDPVQRFIRERL